MCLLKPRAGTRIEPQNLDPASGFTGVRVLQHTPIPNQPTTFLYQETCLQSVSAGQLNTKHHPRPSAAGQCVLLLAAEAHQAHPPRSGACPSSVSLAPTHQLRPGHAQRLMHNLKGQKNCSNDAGRGPHRQNSEW